MTAAYVQSNFSSDTSGGTSLTQSVTLTNPVGYTNAIMVVVGWDNTLATAPTVTDSAGNTYSTALNALNNTHATERYAQYRAVNITGAPSLTITATWGSAIDFRGIGAIELSDVTSSPADGNNGQYQAAPTTGANLLSSLTATNTVQPVLMVGVTINGDGSGRATVSTGFTSAGNLDVVGQGTIETQRFTTTTAKAATFTASISTGHVTFMQMFNENTGTVSPTPTATLTVTPTPTLTVTVTPTQTVTPTSTVTVTPTSTVTLTPTSTVTPTASPTVTATPTVTLTATNTVTPTASPVNPSPTPTLSKVIADYFKVQSSYAYLLNNFNGTGTIDLLNDTLKVMLLNDNSFIPTLNYYIADLLAVITEVTGGNYTQGGVALTTKTLVTSSGNSIVTFDADPVSWAQSNTGFISARAAVIYKDTGVQATSEIFATVDFNGVAKSNRAAPFMISWGDDGIVTIGKIV